MGALYFYICHANKQELMIQNKRGILVATLTSILVLMISYSCGYDSRDEVEPACDTGEATYQLTVKAILASNCTECHSSANPSGGLNFESYSGTFTAAIDGRLLGAIKHLDGFEPMPRFAPKLPECEIGKIEKWVNDGAADN